MRASILLVDDDPGLRSTLESILTAEGFSVQVAEDGLDAKRLISLDSSFELVISDIFMPRLNGLELVNFIAEQRIGTPVILMSAGTYPGEIPDFIDKVVCFFEKPFAIEELINAVSRVLRR